MAVFFGMQSATHAFFFKRVEPQHVVRLVLIGLPISKVSVRPTVRTSVRKQFISI